MGGVLSGDPPVLDEAIAVNLWGKRVRELRKRRGLTATALAHPDYSLSYISQIERGNRRPSARVLEYLARRLGVSVRYLGTGVPDDAEAWLRYEVHAARHDLKVSRAEEVESGVRAVLRRAVEQEIARRANLHHDKICGDGCGPASSSPWSRGNC